MTKHPETPGISGLLHQWDNVPLFSLACPVEVAPFGLPRYAMPRTLARATNAAVRADLRR